MTNPKSAGPGAESLKDTYWQVREFVSNVLDLAEPDNFKFALAKTLVRLSNTMTFGFDQPRDSRLLVAGVILTAIQAEAIERGVPGVFNLRPEDMTDMSDAIVARAMGLEDEDGN